MLALARTRWSGRICATFAYQAMEADRYAGAFDCVLRDCRDGVARLGAASMAVWQDYERDAALVQTLEEPREEPALLGALLAAVREPFGKEYGLLMEAARLVPTGSPRAVGRLLEDVCDQRESRLVASLACGLRGEAARLVGGTEEAAAWFLRSAELWPQYRAVPLLGLARCHLARGDMALAIGELESAVELFRSQGSPWGLAHCAATARDARRPDLAAGWSAEAGGYEERVAPRVFADPRHPVLWF